MRFPLTPPENTEGSFVTNTPFEVPVDVVYRLEAIRTFPELKRAGIDVFSEYYEPAGLARQDYLDDADMDAAILTFKSTDGEIRFIPNTFLESYPGQSTLDYRRNVIVIDCGPTPGYVDVDKLSADLGTLVTGTIGVKTTPEVTVLEFEGVITEEDHVRMEALRKQNIRNTTPLSEQVYTLTQRNNELETLNAQLIEILKANGLSN
ncbi:hypothetical protein BIZ83_gp068 [Erwinia phage vB_EamM_ChrisDB]|jgi:hypothetical protein|uniref:hypothetical protein n=1 Tax=Erwinia phage vB_EamM_ChrisDB TaxID=1883371 RepID=UPI00081C9EFC|nr:hypothetical protein BIZ83_gp068 [Erwinia phage vB_EamM_ChrisDB]ANZ48785.1 hypothetical protein CHRISDB_223 [Erwinia phage vB_EamM_ChrisDB]QVW55739.1 hypothetical protein pEaSNUABM9_00158 [Erwinia phage pEa_SNUABM_9]